MPPVSRAIIIASVVVFLLQASGGGAMLGMFALWPTPEVLLLAPWQLFTYSLLHGSVGHIFFNMFAVYMFGSDLERLWGGRRFALTWLASVLSAALLQILVGSLMGAQAPVVGASGGVFGLLLCYGLLFPDRRLMLLIPPIPIRARNFVLIYGTIELFLGVSGLQPGVAHFAHLGGMLGGWLMLRHYRGPGRRGR